jgi:energy-coupling factor transport system substrate-specific component
MQKSLWSFGTREVVFAAIGAALYGVLTALTYALQIPGTGNVAFRPSVAIVFLFGLAFGPIVGFFTGALGNFIADLVFGQFWPWWTLGNGIMGLVAGLFAPMMTNYRVMGDLIKAEIAVVLGAAAGMFFASLTELWVSNIDFATSMSINFIPAFLSNIVYGLILTPVLLIAYSAIVRRSGR